MCGEDVTPFKDGETWLAINRIFNRMEWIKMPEVVMCGKRAFCPVCGREIFGWSVKYLPKFNCPYDDCRAPLKGLDNGEAEERKEAV